MKHIPNTLMQKVKKHFIKRKINKFDKHCFNDYLDEVLYTDAVGSADIHRLKSLEHSEKKNNGIKI
jgi:hypothetical protein